MAVLLASLVRLILTIAAACLVSAHWPAFSAEDLRADRVFAKDALASPNQTAVIEARLLRQNQKKQTPSEEFLELVQDGKVLVTARTDRSGVAKLAYIPVRKGNMKLTVRTGSDVGHSISAAVTLAVWERRTPLLVVEMAALVDPSTEKPLPDSADELGKLAQFYYNIIYVAADAGPDDEFQAADRVREWLAMHKFPVGYLVVLPSIEKMLGAKLDELRSSGWTTIKIGIGKTPSFAEAFLHRRLDVVIVPKTAKEPAQKKAKAATDWKDVRRKL